MTFIKYPTWEFIDDFCVSQSPLCCLPLRIYYISSEFISGSLLKETSFPYFPFILIHLLICFHMDSWIPISCNVFLNAQIMQILSLGVTFSWLLYHLNTSQSFFEQSLLLAFGTSWCSRLFQFDFFFFWPHLQNHPVYICKKYDY